MKLKIQKQFNRVPSSSGQDFIGREYLDEKEIEIKIDKKVSVIWFDAFGNCHWNSPADVEDGLKNPLKVEMIGYLIKQNKDFVVLAMGVLNDPNAKPFLHLEFIPRGSIKEIKIIK